MEDIYLPHNTKSVSYTVTLHNKNTDFERSCTLVIHDRVGKPWYECRAEELVDGRIQEREHGKASPLEPVVDDHACGPTVSTVPRFVHRRQKCAWRTTHKNVSMWRTHEL